MRTKKENYAKKFPNVYRPGTFLSEMPAHFAFHRVPRQHFLTRFWRSVPFSTPLALSVSNRDTNATKRKGTDHKGQCLFSWLGWRDSAHFAFHRVPRQHFLTRFWRSVLFSTPLALSVSNRDTNAAERKGTDHKGQCLSSWLGWRDSNPRDDGVKVRCLTAWRQPNIYL